MLREHFPKVCPSGRGSRAEGSTLHIIMSTSRSEPEMDAIESNCASTNFAMCTRSPSVTTFSACCAQQSAVSRRPWAFAKPHQRCANSTKSWPATTAELWQSAPARCDCDISASSATAVGAITCAPGMPPNENTQNSASITHSPSELSPDLCESKGQVVRSTRAARQPVRLTNVGACSDEWPKLRCLLQCALERTSCVRRVQVHELCALRVHARLRVGGRVDR